MEKSNKSRLPKISNTRCRRHIEAAAAVPLSKLDDKKNKTTTHMTQERKNYNKKRTNTINKPKSVFSSLSFSSTNIVMNQKKKILATASSLPVRKIAANTVTTTAAAIPTKKYSLSPPATLTRSRIPATKPTTTAATLTATKAKSRIGTANKTAQLPPAPSIKKLSRPTTPAAAAAAAKKVSRPTTPKTPTLIRKSPLTQLKEDIEALRKKKHDDECLIKRQTEEIDSLKKRLELKNALRIELEEKIRSECQLASVTEETKSLSVEVVNLLQVNKKEESAASNYQKEINKLHTQIEAQEEYYKQQLDQKVQQLHELDTKIQTHQSIIDQLKLDHAIQIAQLNSNHMNRIHKLKAEHEQDLNQIKDQFKSSKTTATKDNKSLTVDGLIEQALIEFEQEQYNHPAAPLIKQQETTGFVKGKINLMNNQQWYSKNYMPLDALSWPTPQPMTHLRKLQC